MPTFSIPRHSKIGIFGLKRCHLATLMSTVFGECVKSCTSSSSTDCHLHRMERGPFIISPLGANCDPEEQSPLGVKSSPGGEIVCLPLQFFYVNCRECSPLGVNEGVNIPPRGQNSPLGANVHPWGQTMLLKTGLGPV
jgi:hypothetical protein